MSIFDFFCKRTRTSFHDISNNTKQTENIITQKLTAMLPTYAHIYTTITNDDICIIIIENCTINDVNFDTLGSNLLKCSSDGSVKMNWNYDDPKNGDYVRIIFNIKSPATEDYPRASTQILLPKTDMSAKIHYADHESPKITVQSSIKTEVNIGKSKYIELSTAGDDGVCPMCAQFEGKIFLASDAPKLPLCPSCSCAYKYYFKEDLPENTVLSYKKDFILPADCTSQFYKHQQKIYEENDINKQIRLCEKDLKLPDEFMAPYLLGNFPAPAELACRDLLPELYMLLGKWDKAKHTIKRCIDAHAYVPEDGSHELAYLESYQKVATSLLNYIIETPGCLQRNIYKKLPYEGMERKQLKHFLRYSPIIQKEKCGSTNKLTIVNPKSQSNN